MGPPACPGLPEPQPSKPARARHSRKSSPVAPAEVTSHKRWFSGRSGAILVLASATHVWRSQNPSQNHCPFSPASRGVTRTTASMRRWSSSACLASGSIATTECAVKLIEERIMPVMGTALPVLPLDNFGTRFHITVDVGGYRTHILSARSGGGTEPGAQQREARIVSSPASNGRIRRQRS